MRNVVLALIWIFGFDLVARPIVKIKQGTYSFIPSDSNIDSGAFGPCKAIIIYNTVTKQAIAGHLDESETKQLKSMILFAKDTLGPLSDWEVYISGAFSIMTTSEERTDIIRTFLNSGIPLSKLHIRWLPGAATGSLFFDTEKGIAFLSAGNNEITIQDVPFELFRFNKPKRMNTCIEILTRIRLYKLNKNDFEIIF